MDNCIKTTLKDTVASASLPRLGELLFDVSNVESSRYILCSGNAAYTSKFIAENVTMMFTANDQVYTELAISDAALGTGVKFSNLQSNSRVRVTDKYNLKLISCQYIKPLFTLKELRTLNSNLTKLLLSNSGIEGDIENLSHFANLTELGLDGTNAVGDATAFLDAQAGIRNNGDSLAIYVGAKITNVPAGIGNRWATRGIVTFNGSGGYTISTP